MKAGCLAAIAGLMIMVCSTAPVFAYELVGGTESCQQCHTDYASGSDWHTAHATSVGNDCSKCHDATDNTVPTVNCVTCHAQATDTVSAAGTDGCGWVTTHNDSGQDVCITCHTSCQTDQGTCSASSCLGDEDPRLDVLRKFRDDVLAKSATGRALIKAYYASGDAVIKYLDANPEFKASVTKVLASFAAIIEPFVSK